MSDMYKILKFPTRAGAIGFDYSDEDLAPIKEEVNKIFSNFENSVKYNDQLIGHINREFELIESKSALEKIILPFAYEFDRHFGYTSYSNSTNKDLPLVLDNAWVNFQKKNEFNPVHMHSGVYSFVIWLKIPYTEEDELKNSPGKNSMKNLSGKFAFHYTDVLGDIASFDLDNSLYKENAMFLFPSKLNHSVYPFFSSDDYRISVSGNIKFAVN